MTDDDRARLLALVEQWRKRIERRRDLHGGISETHAMDIQHAGTEMLEWCVDGLAALLPPVGQPTDPPLPKWLTDRIVFPIRWDGADLLDATNRIIVWGKEGPDDPRDDVDRALGKFVADMLNALLPPVEEEKPK